jgi:glycosyltransferase involved in cell wall biosynthesis
MLLQETLKHQDRQRFEFHYIYFLPWKNQMVKGIENGGGTVVNFPAKNNFLLMLQASKVIRYIKQNNINLIHCHLPWAGFMGRYIHWRTGIPVFYSEHNIQERYHFITKWINKITFNYQTKVIAVSQEVAGSIQKNIHPKIPIQTILNGVDTDRFIRNAEEGNKIRSQFSIPNDTLLIGTIAVFRFQKRLKEWIDLFKELQDKNPKVMGCIIGDGPLDTALRNYVRELGLEKKIIMPGLQENVIPWLSAIDIFVMTSLYEGLPIALLEAMSMGCAVVATNAGGVGEVIRDKTDGFLETVEDWKQLNEI